MYNGIGLSSVRGTATSGHVQHNAGHVRNASRRHRTWRNANDGRDGRGGGSVRGRSHGPEKQMLLTEQALQEGATSLALHEKKRRLEGRLLELRDRLEGEGRLGDEEIEKEVRWERERVMEGWRVEEERKDRAEREREQRLKGQEEGEAGEDGGEGTKLLTSEAESKGVEDEPKPGLESKTSDHNVEGENPRQGKESASQGVRIKQSPPRERKSRWGNPSKRWDDQRGNHLGHHGTRHWDRQNSDYHYDRRNQHRAWPGRGIGGGRGGKNAHAQKAFQEQRNERLRDAFGLSDQRNEGRCSFQVVVNSGVAFVLCDNIFCPTNQLTIQSLLRTQEKHLTASSNKPSVSKRKNDDNN